MDDLANDKYIFLGGPMSTTWISIEYIEEKFAEEYRLSFIPPMSMSTKMNEFILKYCRCHHCKSPLKSLCRCSCGQYVEPKPIVVEFAETLYELVYKKIWVEQSVKEKYKRKALNRQSKLETAGKYTKQKVDLLLSVQEGCCYYCASNIIDEAKKGYHIDHYVALSNGGMNEISNLVLACPACNLAKGIQDGNSFTRSLRKKLDLASQNKAKNIRSKVRYFKKLKTNSQTN